MSESLNLQQLVWILLFRSTTHICLGFRYSDIVIITRQYGCQIKAKVLFREIERERLFFRFVYTTSNPCFSNMDINWKVSESTVRIKYTILPLQPSLSLSQNLEVATIYCRVQGFPIFHIIAEPLYCWCNMK